MAAFRNVFITGCNRGIGLEFVKQFLCLPQPPQHLFATCRSIKPENAGELIALSEKNSSLHLLELDVTNKQQLSNVVLDVGEVLKNEGLNLLINNAGITASVTVENVTAEQMMTAYEINTVGPLMLTQSLLPFLRSSGKETTNVAASCRAAIVNISAKTGSFSDNTSGKLYPSRASKAALNIITKSLSIDLKGHGITAVVINPGWVKTANGGPNALITPQESVSGMMNVIYSLDESKTGMFFNYTGVVIPW